MSCSSSEMDPDEMLVPLNVFDEPETFRPPPPPPTCRIYVREPSAVQGGEPAQLRLNLVGGHSLWAHHLWNAGLSMARYLDRHKSLVAGKTTLELGAAAGTPSLIAAINGAACTVITDYPDQPLLDNIEKNGDENAGEAKQAGRVHTVVSEMVVGEVHDCIAERCILIRRCFAV
ncbi:hypothetical protein CAUPRSCDRAFT_12922 [Caulochytrium protostelioides]|uniref:Nicotinamide N-methyltransferase n=1 Tax=Caulochytrium protostelioides TaxID=1555241 RepID=A0A4P9WQE4_9FUNG|nr:hypothetical protein CAUPRSCDRAFT_12922 [Caulochytrium protostelioides]